VSYVHQDASSTIFRHTSTQAHGTSKKLCIAYDKVNPTFDCDFYQYLSHSPQTTQELLMGSDLAPAQIAFARRFADQSHFREFLSLGSGPSRHVAPKPPRITLENRKEALGEQ
jgi:hypothetical protein